MIKIKHFSLSMKIKTPNSFFLETRSKKLRGKCRDIGKIPLSI